MPTAPFHPSVRDWFERSFEAPTDVQTAAWPRIRDSQHVLIAAPTGSGKTLAAFLCAIDDLVRESRQHPLTDQVHVLYVSPLKALSNDIERNLQAPMQGIADGLAEACEPASGIRVMLRTGDTTPGEREKMRRRPPHILVTTPESLYLLLTSASGRAMLSAVREVIIDEIHAVAGGKRGSHLSLSLARLDALVQRPPRRIGLSATQKPIERIANFLTGGEPCAIVDTGHQRHRDLQLVIPSSPLSPVMSNEVWTEIHDRIEALVEEHRTTLIFVNTRRLSERLARHLAERLGEDAVTAHHGSLSREHRLEAEQALKHGRLRALVATASLELGIDIGHIDLVCQLGSPHSIAAFLQRVGRAGHAVNEVPKGRLFPLSRDDLVECVALLRSVERDELDVIHVPEAPLDVLAQQIVAEVSAGEWSTDSLFRLVATAWPYRRLPREDFDAVIDMLAQGFATRRGRRAAFIHHDAINGVVRPRRGASLVALQNAGAIPDHFDYEVVMLPQGHRIGTLNEDFAFESIPGDIFQLGNTSYRILKIEQGRVLVEDAHGQPPNIPFWTGEAPGRSDELSLAVSALRTDVEAHWRNGGPDEAIKALLAEGIVSDAAEQMVAYLGASCDALQGLPTHSRIVLERFFDDTGDMHLVIHAPLGSRLMRAWGLALRKRFCRRFNFELQAAALEDCLILSLGETHSFELSEVPGYLSADSVREVLIQALLDAPMFEVRWRWTATTALAVQRMRNGQRVPPQWQRNAAEDLVAVVFPDQIACLENIRGAREIPNHPLVRQTIDDCLHETMDIDGLERLLRAIKAGEIEIHCADLTAPSPLSKEIINARPYAFLDDGEAENRRTRAISSQPDDLGNAASLRIIRREAVDQVRDEAWIRPRDAEELHDGLLTTGFITGEEAGSGCASSGAPGEASGWPAWFKSLSDERRAATAHDAQGRRWWVATERSAEWRVIFPEMELRPDPDGILPAGQKLDPATALVSLLRSRLSSLGPVTEQRICMDFGLPETDIRVALATLETEGFAVRMQTENDGADTGGKGGGRQWCERRLLARIHRYSRERRRRAVRAVPPAAYMSFLAHWHGLDEPPDDLGPALDVLEGWMAPVIAWEGALLKIRCHDYSPEQLDLHFLSGNFGWYRPLKAVHDRSQIVAATPVAIARRGTIAAWRSFHGTGANAVAEDGPDSTAQKVLDALCRSGAMFTPDLEQETGLLRPQLEQGLKSLVADGLVSSDAFSPLRWLLRPEAQKRKGRRRRQTDMPLGRWSAVAGSEDATPPGAAEKQRHLSTVCAALLKRYGVVFRAVIQRETGLPPWRLLLGYLRRMEDRGEVQGGRFVDGFSGEQFALPEAAGALRQFQGKQDGDSIHVISASDPLNLGGLIVAGPRTPSVLGNRVALAGGEPVARLVAGETEFLRQMSPARREATRRQLEVVRDWRNTAGGRR